MTTTYTAPLDALWSLYSEGTISIEDFRTARDSIAPQCRGCGEETMVDRQSGLGVECYARMANVTRMPTGKSGEVWR